LRAAGAAPDPTAMAVHQTIHSPAIDLLPHAEADALKGHIVHALGAVLAVSEGKGYSRLVPDTPVIPKRRDFYQPVRLWK